MNKIEWWKILANGFVTACMPLIGLTLFNSCNVINPAEPIPGYVHLDSMSLSSDIPTQGSASSKISDAWVFIDNEYLGTYEMPVTFPVINSGVHKISIRGGIINNGISGSRAPYSKYQSSDTTLSIVPGSKITWSPVTRYYSSIQFPQLEDFDDGSLSMINTSIGLASINITLPSDPNAFEQNSGMVTLDTGHAVFEVASADSFQLPVTTPVYMELNYKCETEFSIGVFVNISGGGVIQTPLLNVRSSSTWKKIYVNISDLGGLVSAGSGYKIFLHADLPSGLNTATLYFDNLKVVY